MRTTLLPGLLAAVAANLTRQAERVAVFEQGASTFPGPTATCRRGAGRQGRRPAVAGRRAGDAGHRPVRVSDRGELDRRAAAGRLLHDEGLRRAPAGRFADRRAAFERSQEPYLHPGKAADLLLGDDRVGPSACCGPIRRGLRYRGPRRVRRRAGRGAASCPRPGDQPVRGSAHVPAGQPGPRRRARRRRAAARVLEIVCRAAASCCARRPCSTSTRATRCRPASARWPCGCSCVRPTAR